MTTAAESLLPLLFGDRPLDAWPPAAEPGAAADELPWSAFVEARQHLLDGDQDLAIRSWASVSAVGAWESRHTLQAWHFLREVGVQPDESIAHQVLGVVAEVAVDGGHDALAAYRAGGVRYLNHAGPVVVVEDGPPQIHEFGARFLDAAQAVAGQLGPWAEPTLPDLPVGHSRFTMLTPSGPHLGQGPDEVLRSDALAAPLFDAATRLLVAVYELSPPT
ncbi:MAG: hypothetical protein JWM89_1766 [Acidimicrobiales bacterium]|nr:hypothetical protein [Acidimicrobiales bacterium]